MNTQTPHKNIIPREWFENTVRNLPPFTTLTHGIRCELEQMNEEIYRVFLVGEDGKLASESRIIVEFEPDGYNRLANPRVTLHLEKKLFDGFAVDETEAARPRGSERANLRRPQRGDLELSRELIAEFGILCGTAETIARSIESYAAGSTAA